MSKALKVNTALEHLGVPSLLQHTTSQEEARAKRSPRQAITRGRG